MWEKIFLLLVLLILGYGFFVEPNLLRVNHITIKNEPLAKMLAGKKIAILGDIHLGESQTDRQRKILEALQSINPDIILLTGDYVTSSSSDVAFTNALAFLDSLEAPLGIYGVLGNADLKKSRYSCLFCHERGTSQKRKSKVTMLSNASREIIIGPDRIKIIGVDYSSTNDYADIDLFQKNIKNLPALVISHTSVPFGHIKGNNVFMAAGDTHGGQIWLPNIFWKIFGIKPDPDHMYGLYQEGSNSLYITGGIGTSTVPFRLGVPPEITAVEFKP